MIEHAFNLWDKVIDKVTGFEGVVMSITQYATGCIHYGIAPQVDKDGKMLAWEYLDQSRLEWAGNISTKKNPDKTTSGSFPCPPQQ